MTQEQYQQQLTIANAYREKEDFREAEHNYRLALKHAPPQDMQSLIDTIREMKERARTAPRPEGEKQRGEDMGFQIYKTTFNDVIGYKRHKKLIIRWVGQPIKRATDYTELRMAKSTGILFYGPPGTGKTFLSNGISGELKLPMKDIDINKILDKLVGGSEKNMAKAFEEAKACQPSILFFDELDALGASREAANEFTSNDIKNTINEFLKQLSRLHDNKEDHVCVIGATNLPWQLDPALLRSGRIEHHIFIGPPGFWNRRALFRYYMRLESTKWRFKANLSLLALATIRYSPADIEKVCTAVKSRVLEDARRDTVITTRDVQRVLKDRNEGASSLDEWTLKAKQTYLKKSKTVVEKTGFMGWRQQKRKIEEQGKMSDEELKIYKPLVNYIKREMRWWTTANIIRRMAKGI